MFLNPALARPQQKWHYEQPDVATLAAALRLWTREEPPLPGQRNKRIGFLAMITFLGLSGQAFDATDAEVVAEILALADGRLSEAELATWIRSHCSKPK